MTCKCGGKIFYPPPATYEHIFDMLPWVWYEWSHIDWPFCKECGEYLESVSEPSESELPF